MKITSKLSTKQLIKLVNAHTLGTEELQNVLSILAKRNDKNPTEEAAAAIKTAEQTITAFVEGFLTESAAPEPVKTVKKTAKTVKVATKKAAKVVKVATAEPTANKGKKYNMHGSKIENTKIEGKTVKPSQLVWFLTGSKNSGFKVVQGEYRHRAVSNYSGSKGVVIIKVGKKIYERRSTSVFLTEASAKAESASRSN